MPKTPHRERILQEAWVGDAVLSLYAREKILREDQRVDGRRLTLMTSNHFLSALGEPSEVEAEIGRVYGEAGLSAAFNWIETRVIPLFQKQEANRLRKGRL